MADQTLGDRADVQQLEQSMREKAAKELEWIPVSSVAGSKHLARKSGIKLPGLIRQIGGFECMVKQRRAYFRLCVN